MKLYTSLIILFLLIQTHVVAQTTIAFQGGEGTAADNWGFAAITNAGGSIAPGIVTTLPRTGTKSIRAAGGNTTGCGGGSNCIAGGGATTCPMHGNTISFNSINTSCLAGVQLTCYHRSHTLCSGSGFDGGDFLYFEVRLNGGAWTTQATVTGSGDLVWAYGATASGVANPFTYNVPAGTTAFEFRVRATVNRSDEVFYIDDVKLTTTSTGYGFPGTAGLWGGYVSTDWFNACNWNDRTVPTAATNVTFPSNNTGNRDIVINASTNPACNNLTINGSGSKQIKGEGDATKKLTINGNLTLSSTDGLDFSDGTTGSADGTIEIYGNWNNTGVESDFKEGNSSVKFMGTANQTISTADAAEAFYNLTINKSSGTVTMNDNVWIDKDVEGGTNPLLVFTQGKIDLNNKELKIFNSNEQAVSRTLGGVISEKTTNLSKMTWAINNNTGAHIFPFIRTDNFYIPFTFNLTAGDVDEVTVSTYPTAANNTPYPVTPQAVTNVDNTSGMDNSSNMVNRFWQIDKTGSSGTADLTFTYGDNEWDVLEPGDYEAQRWASSTWQTPSGTQTQNTTANSVSVSGISAFSPWTLASPVSTLPVELLSFNAMYNAGNDVDVTWTTTTEINNDFFTVERSANAQTFEPVLYKKGAGNSRGVINYADTDTEPLNGVSYYRLKQTDFDKTFRYSTIVSVEKNRNENNQVTVMPNPTENGIIYIIRSTDEKEQITIDVFDATGKQVVELMSAEAKTQIDLSDFDKGMYLIRISGTNFKENRRVVFN